MDVLVCFCTVPSEDVASKIAETVVGERLAACVNTVGGLRSTYRWQGAVESDDEVLLIVKTTEKKFESLRDRIVALHPYECPEVIAWPITHGLPSYLGWIAQEVG